MTIATQADPNVLIIGAGAAGCALAARLSADPTVRVRLLEAGPDLPPGQEPAHIRDPFPGALGGSEFTWPGLTAEVFAARPGRAAVRRNFIQGQVVGGSSTINGMMAQRGLPADYDAWAARGADGWDWQGVLPYFKALESDLDFDGPLHGSSGPIPIRREPREAWAPFARAVTQAMLARGHAWFDDFNGEFGDGVGPVPLNNRPEHRVSAAMGYLDAATRRRSNLQLQAETRVTRLLLEGRRVVGVEAVHQGRAARHRARETIVCAGAVHTPALLLRSGISPADELRRLGIAVAADRPGVGRNLLNHVMIHVATHLPATAMQRPDAASWAYTVLRYSSGVEGCPAGDMQIFPINRTAWHALGSRIGAMGLCLYQPRSVGSVSLLDADPATPPDLRFRLLEDERDERRLADGLRRIFELLADDAVAPLHHEVFMPNKAFAGRLAARTAFNAVRTRAIERVLAAAPAVRRALLGASVVDPRALLDDPAALRAIVQAATAHVHHVCGTCRFGTAQDPLAVVDPQCRVHGVDGLRIGDTSVMPSSISANTHLAAMMIGEKLAATLLAT
jgi:5-(hydroxymethyl)furfural/furfural oxidase